MKPAQTTHEHQKNTDRHIMEHPDPAGTDPNRYNTSGRSETSGNDTKKPDNHTSPEERMITPNRGE